MSANSGEDDLQLRLRNYYRREEIRTQMGKSIITAFRHAEGNKSTATTVGYAKREGVPDELIEEFQEAAKVARTPEGVNLNVDTGPISSEQVNTLGDALRIHPALREGMAQAIREGRMQTIVAFDNEQPVARVNLIHEGPKEEEVIKELGGGIPYIHDLWVNEGYRGRQIGPRLTLECEQTVIKSPDLPKIISLAVRPSNVRARGMYETRGYKYRKVGGKDTFTFLPDFEGDEPRETLLMVKDLSVSEE